MAYLLAGSIAIAGSLYAGTGIGMQKMKTEADAAAKARVLKIDGSTQVKGGNSLFRGLGAVTCNGSSRLLMDYKEESRPVLGDYELAFPSPKGCGALPC